MSSINSSPTHKRRFLLNEEIENLATADLAAFMSILRAWSTTAGSSKRDFRTPM